MSLCSRPLLKTKILIRFFNRVGFWLKILDRNKQIPSFATLPPLHHRIYSPTPNQTLARPAASHPFPLSTPSLLLELKIISCRICFTFQKLLVVIQQHTAILELEEYSSNNIDNTYTEREILIKGFVNKHLFYLFLFQYVFCLQ